MVTHGSMETSPMQSWVYPVLDLQPDARYLSIPMARVDIVACYILPVLTLSLICAVVPLFNPWGSFCSLGIMSPSSLSSMWVVAS